MQAFILSVGDEVVTGQIADTNAAWLSQRLLGLGVVVLGHAAVRDVEAEIIAAVRRAAERSDLVLMTGGLGPTHDDLTREAVAAAAGTPLINDPASLEHIREIFAARGLEMPASNAKQATFPQGGDVIFNPGGTAAGFRVTVGRASVFVLPGVPSEMRAMFDGGILPLLPETHTAIVVRMLKCFGMSESMIAERLGRILDLYGNPRVAFLPSAGTITVKFTATTATRAEATALLEPMVGRAAEALGEVVFGEDDATLQSAVARLLKASGKTLAVAESCTGGLVCHWLTEVPGISEHLLEGAVTYSNAAKTRRLGVPPALFDTVGAVSEEVARAMAEGMREQSGADLGLGITGIAGPSGGSPEKPVGTVHIALATPERTVHQKWSLVGTRTLIQFRAAKYALNLIRLELLRSVGR